MAVNYGRQDFDRVVNFRPHNVYGPDMGWEHVIPQFAVRMKKLCDETPPGPISFPIQGTGQETRAFVFVDDAIDGIVRVIQQGEHLGIYNVGTPLETSIAELAEEAGRFFGRDINIVPGELQPGGTMRRCPDVKRLQALGFEPNTSLRDGLCKTLTWYTAHAGMAPRSQ